MGPFGLVLGSCGAGPARIMPHILPFVWPISDASWPSIAPLLPAFLGHRMSPAFSLHPVLSSTAHSDVGSGPTHAPHRSPVCGRNILFDRALCVKPEPQAIHLASGSCGWALPMVFRFTSAVHRFASLCSTLSFHPTRLRAMRGSDQETHLKPIIRHRGLCNPRWQNMSWI